LAFNAVCKEISAVLRVPGYVGPGKNGIVRPLLCVVRIEDFDLGGFMTDPRRQRRLWYIVGTIAIIGFIAFGASSFKSNLTPYVSFDDARSRPGKVQIAGKLVEGSTHYVEGSQNLSFGLVDDDGSSMSVLYSGVKPGNFEEAVQIVAIGDYRDETFHADQLLVKCPSKYQGLDDDVTKHGGEA